MIGVEPFVHLLEGSCVLVSVVSSRCPCLWEPRFFQVELAFVFHLMPSDRVLCPCVIFVHLDEHFAFASQIVSLCSYVVNILIKGEKFDMNLDCIVMSVLTYVARSPFLALY